MLVEPGHADADEPKRLRRVPQGAVEEVSRELAYVLGVAGADC